MRVGVVFPQLDSGTDPQAIVEYSQAVEQLGYTHLVAYDHVLGVDRSVRPDFKGPYDSTSLFHEVFVLLSFIAAVTTRLEIAPSVVILPQRQTALVAKQAAALDVLARGRTRLGVGLGWNEAEFVALGEDFATRAKRYSEQITVLRLLFTQEIVEFTGRYHRLERVGLNPLPVQRPIPIWMGGATEDALRRIARIGDGWFAQYPPSENGRAAFARFRDMLRANGRDADAFPIEGRISLARVDGGLDAWVGMAHEFRDELRCTHLELNTMAMGLASLADHVRVLESFAHAARDLFDQGAVVDTGTPYGEKRTASPPVSRRA